MLIDITGVAELRNIRIVDEQVIIGAGTTLSSIAADRSVQSVCRAWPRLRRCGRSHPPPRSHVG